LDKILYSVITAAFFFLIYQIFAWAGGSGDAGANHEHMRGSAAAAQHIGGMIERLSGGRLTKEENSFVVALILIYGGVVGFASTMIMGEHGFGFRINTLLALFGIFATLLVYGLVMETGSADHALGLFIASLAMSTLSLFAAAAVKTWLHSEAHIFFRGGDVKAVTAIKPAKGARRNSGVDRLQDLSSRSK
jgi:hypothetical protein